MASGWGHCPHLNSSIVLGSNITLGDYNDTSSAPSCKAVTYIRPDEAGSFLPWPYTLIWFLIHFPVTLIRVHRWERVQALSIVLAVTTIWFHIQAYKSGTRPESVLVWMPIFVVLDIGAMMQLVFLIVEESGWRPLIRALPRTFRRARGNGQDCERIMVQNDHAEGEFKGVCRHHSSPMNEAGSNLTTVKSMQSDIAKPAHEMIGKAWTAIFAFTLGLFLLIIQMYGFSKAVKGARESENIKADWCSTIFTTGLAVQSGCDIHPVEPSFSQGIGCIKLPGHEQRTWLKVTVIVVSISLVFQVFDAIILTLVNATTRWRGAKMKRPWFTMFTGNILLLVLIVIGVFQSQRLPVDINRFVTVYSNLWGPQTCVGELTPYGVRGAIIGWSDGFLGSWDGTYRPTGGG